MQYLRLIGVLRYTVHFGLQLLCTDWSLPMVLQGAGLPQIACDFPFDLRLRHYSIKCWLGIGALFRPDAITPVNFFNRPLITYTLCKRQSGSFRMRTLRRRFSTEESQQSST